MTSRTVGRLERVQRGGAGSFRRMWIGVNLLGFAAAGAAFGAVQRARSQQYFEVVTSALAAARIEAVNTGESLALFGVLVGSAQWLVLRRRPYARWWIPATAVGWSVTGVAVGTISGLAFGSVSTIGPDRSPAVMAAGAIGGALLVSLLPSGGQWLVLRPCTARANHWPLINLAGLIPGLIVAGIVVRWALVDVVPWLTPYDFPSAKALVCVGAVTGLVYGAITAYGAARLFYCGDPDQGAGGR